MSETFGERLHRAVRERGPLCVGIDPHPDLIRAWGLPDDPEGLDEFCRRAVSTLADRVAIFKPQSAFFERHGSRGIAVLERVIVDAHAGGALVLIDAKRGDIGSTVQAYADAYVDPSSPLCCDAVTASPYLGFESLRPLIDTAARHGNGVFVLALTSNPDGREVQQATSADGRTVAGTILEYLRRENAGADPLGSMGAVVGATVEPPEEDLDIGGPLLAPGIGHQGGTPSGLLRIFGEARRHVLPSVSRDLLRAGPDASRLRETADRLAESCRVALYG